MALIIGNDGTTLPEARALVSDGYSPDAIARRTGIDVRFLRSAVSGVCERRMILDILRPDYAPNPAGEWCKDSGNE